MDILVVGSGGREHALAWSLARSPRVGRLLIAPGNAGTAALGENVAVAADDIDGLVDLACREQVDLVVVGPEVPLALGLVDRLVERGIAAFGPMQAAARIEASKAFSKDFMRDNDIPTAGYGVFEDYDEARAYLQSHPVPVVVKASGLAAGKGVIVCQTDEQAKNALDTIMLDKAFGCSGDQVIIEDCLTGQEVSVLAFCDGKTAVPMLLSQDHKAAYEGDKGPNTGGMGTYAPASLLDEAMMARVQAKVLQPTVDAMARAGTPYVGVLYAGLMIDSGDFSVLEFNCRFGDPETQVLLPLLKTDLVEVILACVNGTLDQVELAWSEQSCVCVVMASGGYPGSYKKGYRIGGLEAAAALPDTVVFHAGTRLENGNVLTAGGRVLGVTAWADDLATAVERAYRTVDEISWPEVMVRRDIGAKGLKES